MTEPDTTEPCTECGVDAGEPCKDECWLREEGKHEL